MTLDHEGHPTTQQETLNELLKFPLMEALAGRRSRRFCMGAEIPDGVLAFKSKHKPLPLSELEQLLVLWLNPKQGITVMNLGALDMLMLILYLYVKAIYHHHLR